MEDNNKQLKQLKMKANKLPLTPGVYLMKNYKEQVIYVGKAKSLKNRVTQYFGKGSNHTNKVQKMVSNISDFDYILCDSEYEALMLENSLIKQYMPKYNVLLKDDKGYHYIKITNEVWPKIQASKIKVNDGSKYIGPFYSGNIVRETVDEVNKIFKLPTCNRSFDNPSKACLNYHLGQCFAPCKNNAKHSEYIETINNAVSYIKNGGMNSYDINLLKQKMLAASDNLDFEYAARLRDRIRGIEKSRERQKVVSSTYKNQDVFAMAMSGETACISLLMFRDSKLSDKKNFYLNEITTKADTYAEFLLQYYSNADYIPSRIVLDCQIEDSKLFEEWLSNVKNQKVAIHFPQKGEQLKLVNMCLSNAVEGLSQKIERDNKEMTALNELSSLLGIEIPPKRIEAYDISHMAGSNTVGAMVVFINGRSNKSLYRKFKIESLFAQDDYRSLSEVIDRRIKEYLDGNDESFSELPDLILLDGGKGQVSAVRKVLDSYNLNIKLFGMVKDSKHRTRAITAGGEDIQIKANRKTYTLITNIQDEVHRFAISYHKTRAKNSNLTLQLLNIEGVGENTSKKLIAAFKTISKIKSAEVEDFIKLGINKRTSENIYNYYKKYK